MRLATLSRTLMASAASALLAASAFAQMNISPNSVRDQLNQSNGAPQASTSQPQQGASQAEVKAPKKPAAPAPKASAPASTSTPGAPAAAVPAKPQATSPARPAPAGQGKAPAAATAKAKTAAPAKAPTNSAEKDAKKPTDAAKEPAKAAAPPTASAEKAPEEKPVVRRDPFDTLLTKARAGNAPPENLPPGKAGLIVETLRIDGIVHSPNGMIAIVSNPQQRVYFLRDGDKLYDGAVDKIALDSISFHEVGKDAFGKPLERTVTKQLYPSSGEQR